MNLYDNQFFSPMFLEQVKKPFNDDDYIFELKFDGIRALIFVEPNKINIQSRKGIQINDKFPELLSIKNNVQQKVIFDGEIVIISSGKPSFEKLQRRIRLKDITKIDYYAKSDPVVFIAYDIIYENKNLIDLPLLERKKILNKYKDTKNFVKAIYIKKEGIKLFNKIKKENLEGIIAKKINSQYKINSRSSDWVKIKNLQDEDYFICGFKEEVDKPMASLLLGKIKKNKLIKAGTVNIGKKNPDFLIIKKNPRNNKPKFKLKNYIYIMPNLECKIEFIEKTENGNLRHPVYKSLK